MDLKSIIENASLSGIDEEEILLSGKSVFVRNSDGIISEVFAETIIFDCLNNELDSKEYYVSKEEIADKTTLIARYLNSAPNSDCLFIVDDGERMKPSYETLDNGRDVKKFNFTVNHYSDFGSIPKEVITIAKKVDFSELKSYLDSEGEILKTFIDHVSPTEETAVIIANKETNEVYDVIGINKPAIISNLNAYDLDSESKLHIISKDKFIVSKPTPLTEITYEKDEPIIILFGEKTGHEDYVDWEDPIYGELSYIKKTLSNEYNLNNIIVFVAINPADDKVNYNSYEWDFDLLRKIVKKSLKIMFDA